MIRIRYMLLVLFGFLALLPLAAFGLWSYSQSVQNEFDAVNDKHLLLARNLGTALERYHNDVVSVFDITTNNLIAETQTGDTSSLFANLDMQFVCITDAQTGRVLAGASVPGTACPETFSAERMDTFRDYAGRPGTWFTEVMDDGQGGNAMYVVQRADDMLSIGCLSTDYFVELGRAISFGSKGHAAIVDHRGNVLAHPLPEWLAERKNIAAISAVRRMLRGETGIEQFYSPALKGDMIAGFTTVADAGWGVMIPQPVDELYQNAAATQSTALQILGVSLVGAIGLAIFVAFRLSRPVERVIAANATRSKDDQLTQIDVESGFLIPGELVQLQKSFNDMVVNTKRSQTRIRRLAFTDSVTALPNRESFELTVTRQIELLNKKHESGVLIFADVDEFRIVNDTLGHDSGDQILRALADRLTFAVEHATGQKSIYRHPDSAISDAKLVKCPVIARVGGDEFMIFVPNLDKSLNVERVMREIHDELARPFQAHSGVGAGQEFKGGATLSAACYPAHGKDYDTLVKMADIAMYHAKRKEKGESLIYRPEIGDVTAAELRADIVRGIAADEFVLHYQPKIKSRDGSVETAEALIRWRHPQRGLLSPGHFIPMVEDYDEIIGLGEWAVRAAARQIARWDKSGIKLNVAVNIASRHFGAPDFVTRVSDIVRREGVDPARIELEITEETVLSSLVSAKKIIDSLKKTGFSIALDDFGRGYSNLRRLSNLVVDTLKIDGPLTAGVTEDERTRVIVASTIEMARGLNCTTVAEGVETAEQAMMLTKLGCDEQQGFYHARPMEPDLMSGWLNDRKENGVHNMQNDLVKQMMKRAANS